ncbi:MAG: GTP cyclohydrolase FolE2 [Gemmatimonadota bacterium]
MTPATSSAAALLHDVQAESDTRGLHIDRVGVSGLSDPISVLDRHAGRQQTVGQITLAVSLPHDQRGTHMSRFIEVFEHHRGEMTIRTLPGLLEELRARLSAEAAQIEVAFPYFVERRAPVTGRSAMMDYACAFRGRVDAKGEAFSLRTTVPVSTLCPCSKEISDYGAHNQRGYVTVEVGTTSSSLEDLVWIEEVIDWVESSASAPVYPLLKRPDERHVTMQAYDNPRFVEDLVREVAGRIRDDARVAWFSVAAENLESIHNHSAFAEIRWSRPER